MKRSLCIRKLRDLKTDERGQGMAEYIIITVLVSIIVLVGIRVFGQSVFNQFEEATGEIDELQAGAPGE